MRQFLLILLSIIIFPVALRSQDERIYTHHSDVVVDTSSVIRVSEKIKIYANGDLFKRGITRSLPTTRPDVDGKRIRMKYNIIEVYRDGRKEPYFKENEGGFLVLYIGDKNKMLDYGYYEYEIVYETAGQIGFFDSYDELAWNVNGESYRPVDLVSCSVILPNNAKILSSRCYTGAYGATDGDCHSDVASNGVFTASSSSLQPNEMMTVYVGFEKGIVREPVKKEGLFSRLLAILDSLGLWFVNAIFFIPLLFYYITTWRRYGVDPPKPVVVPQFEPPYGMSPASVAVIHQERFASEFVSASVINLAVKGFLRIEEHKHKGLFALGGNQYKLIKIKNADVSLPAEEATIMNKLFYEDSEITLSDKYNSNVKTTVELFVDDLKDQHSKTINEGRNLKLKILPWFATILYFAFLVYFGQSIPMELYLFFFIVSTTAFISTVIGLSIFKAIKKKRQKGNVSIALAVAILVGVIGAFLYFPINRMSSTAIAILIGLPIILIGHIIYSKMIVRPSEKKLQMQADIEGLKMYLSLAEEKQIQFFNPPELTPAVFEKFLPYAIALNVDKVWGEKFEKTLLNSLRTNDTYIPAWYVGNAMRPASFGNSLHKSLVSNIIMSSTSSSSSSGGNWGSGSFGGGSVGGGGGGGRTGGW